MSVGDRIEEFCNKMNIISACKFTFYLFTNEITRVNTDILLRDIILIAYLKQRHANHLFSITNDIKMRAFTIISFLCLLVACACQSHDLVLGQATYGDVIVFKQNEYKYGFPFIVRSSVIEYPEPGQQNFAYIRAIHIKDHERDGSGGYPTISAGGLGQRFVKIKLKSQRGSGFNFTVTLYGRYQ